MNRAVELNLQSFEKKWQSVLEVLQLAMGAWDSSGELIGRCWNYLGTKRTMEIGCGLQDAKLALFLQKNGDFVYKEV